MVKGRWQRPDGRPRFNVCGVYLLVENTEKDYGSKNLETNQSQQLRHEEPIQNVSSFFLFFAAFFKGRI